MRSARRRQRLLDWGLARFGMCGVCWRLGVVWGSSLPPCLSWWSCSSSSLSLWLSHASFVLVAVVVVRRCCSLMAWLFWRVRHGCGSCIMLYWRWLQHLHSPRCCCGCRRLLSFTVVAFLTIDIRSCVVGVVTLSGPLCPCRLSLSRCYGGGCCS